MNGTKEKLTHFGFQKIEVSKKADKVKDVFTSVVGSYDLMNDLMSFGLHRLWKGFAVSQSGLRTGNCVLDVAAGSGDLSMHFAKRVGKSGKVVVTDINQDMLALGKDRIINQGYVGNIQYALADAENLPFNDDSFNCVAISFGLRNVTNIGNALVSMCRVLKPGGRLLVLEFSRPVIPLLKKVYDSYSFSVIPRLGKLVVKDEDSYRYLVESIRKHPDQQQLKAIMHQAGFDQVRVHNLTGGIVALHLGVKY